MSNPTIPPPPGPAPAAERAWSAPGLLRRVEARPRRVRPERRPRRGVWTLLHRRRWSAEGTMMIVVAAVCILLTVLAVSASRGGPGVVSSGAQGCALSTGSGAGMTCLSGAP